MAKFIPSDLPCTPFVLEGSLKLDGHGFCGGEYTLSALVNELRFFRKNIGKASIQHPAEWLKIRDIVVSYYWSSRGEPETSAIQSFLEYIFSGAVDIRNSSAATILALIEDCLYTTEITVKTKPLPVPTWVTRSTPPSRFHHPEPRTTKKTAKQHTTHLKEQTPLTSACVLQPQTIHDPPTTIDHLTNENNDLDCNHTSIPSPTAVPAPNTHHPLYIFEEHKQEYDGYQFQCPHRCLKDGKHCRKAPVREMNRHLRTRHRKNPGFKIAGVDWDRKVWRGLGAGEKECIGRIVEKDAPDEASDVEVGGNPRGGDVPMDLDSDATVSGNEYSGIMIHFNA